MNAAYLIAGDLYCNACGERLRLRGASGVRAIHSVGTHDKPMHCALGASCVDPLVVSPRSIVEGAWLRNLLTRNGELQIYAAALHDPGNALLRWYLHSAYSQLGDVLDSRLCLLPCALCGAMKSLTRMAYLDEASHPQDELFAHMRALQSFHDWTPTPMRLMMRICTDISNRAGSTAPDPHGRPRLGLVHKYVCEDCVAEIRAL